jgi:hypothetical protein
MVALRAGWPEIRDRVTVKENAPMGIGAPQRLPNFATKTFLLFDEFDVEGDGYVFADHAGVFGDAVIGTIDYGGGGGAAALIAPRVFDGFGGAVDGEGHGFGDAVKGEVAGHG